MKKHALLVVGKKIQFLPILLKFKGEILKGEI